MNYKQITEEIAEYVRDRYRVQSNTSLIYHDLEHTEEVVSKTRRISRHYKLDERELFIVTSAAWFHDLGYLMTSTQHEERSSELAVEFLTAREVNDDDIRAIEKCIMATRIPQEAESLEEQIICDADLYHLGTKNFFKNDKKMHREHQALSGVEFSKANWYANTIAFLENHIFLTGYCRDLLTEKQQYNLRELKHQLHREAKKHPKKEINDQLKQDPEPAEERSEKAGLSWSKKDRPEKGIETMFKISSGNHQRLSGMADNKAHIMITVNSIILSAIISILLRKLNEYNYLVVPTCILLGVSLLAMTFSILATRPSIPAGIFLRSDVDEKRVNLLFFGNFYRMPLEDFTYGMEKMMEDHELLYGSLIRDVYAQGVVLGKKYRLLRAAYNVFMYGLIIAVLSFLVAVLFFNQPDTSAVQVVPVHFGGK